MSTSLSTSPKDLNKGGLSSTTPSYGIDLDSDSSDAKELLTCNEMALDVCSGGGGSDAGVPVTFSAR